MSRISGSGKPSNNIPKLSGGGGFHIGNRNSRQKMNQPPKAAPPTDKTDSSRFDLDDERYFDREPSASIELRDGWTQMSHGTRRRGIDGSDEDLYASLPASAEFRMTPQERLRTRRG